MMDLFLTISGWALFGVVAVIGLVLDAVGLFGNWLILAAVAVGAVVSGFEHFGIGTLAALTGLALLGEAIEFAASSYGAARFGGGKAAALGALVGCIAGAIAATPILPPLGTILGGCLGAFAGAAGAAALFEEKDPNQAFRTGIGAATGKIGGMIAKVTIGIVMIVFTIAAY